jgi:serine/threonine protein kinase
VVRDVGLLDASQAPISSHIFFVVAVTIVLALTARMAAVSRASMRAALLRSHEAMQVARKGEALLAEAQQQLERALGVAIGKPSHYSGQVAGAYRLELVVGIGAMGEVYSAEHLETGKLAAVKLLRPSSLSRPDLVERFLREGAICTALKSPHLVEVYDVGTLADGAPYLTMELLEGSDLAARLRKDGSLPLAEVLELAEALAQGLTQVHAAGVVHRDLKPVNVFQTGTSDQRRVWKILDFGVSKQRTSTGTLTDVGVVGTPGYMSPEQARGLPVDHRSDIFAMGLVLYRSLTGRPAFSGNDTPQIMFEVVYKMPERPSATVKNLPSEVDLVFAIALAKDPRERWASVRELADALALAAQKEITPELRRRAHGVLRTLPWSQPVSVGTNPSDAETQQQAPKASG